MWKSKPFISPTLTCTRPVTTYRRLYIASSLVLCLPPNRRLTVVLFRNISSHQCFFYSTRSISLHVFATNHISISIPHPTSCRINRGPYACTSVLAAVNAGTPFTILRAMLAVPVLGGEGLLLGLAGAQQFPEILRYN
jgi:hypothetical protein